MNIRWLGFAAVVGGCVDWHEGMQVGECIDGVDNDDNGIVDCADVGCMASPDCVATDGATEAGSAAAVDESKDTGIAGTTEPSEVEEDEDSEWLNTDEVWDDSCNRNTVQLTLPTGEVRVLDGWVWFRGDFGPELIGIERGGRDTCQQVVLDDQGGFDRGIDAVEADGWRCRNPSCAFIDKQRQAVRAGIPPQVALFGLVRWSVANNDQEVILTAEGFNAPFFFTNIPGVCDAVSGGEIELVSGENERHDQKIPPTVM